MRYLLSYHGDTIVFEGLIPWIVGGIVLLIIIIFVFYFIGIYNRLYTLKNSSEATLGQIRVAMKKRLDMIDQLLGAVKSYAKFEQETLEKVTEMRAKVGTAGPGDLNDIEKESRSLFGRLIAVAENYPDLKTNTTVLNLQDSIRSIEEEIARQRYTYNNISQQFNIMCDTIPSKFIANMIHMQKLDYLQFEEQISTPPKIEF